jgi:hypothetical protein
VTEALRDLIEARELWIGAVIGMVGVAVLLRYRSSWGAALVGSSVVTLATIGRLSVLLALGLVVLAAGGAITDGAPFTSRLRATAPGAGLVALAVSDAPVGWLRLAAFISTMEAALALSDFSVRYSAVGVLLPVTVLGVYLATPDTELSLALLGASGAAGLAVLLRCATHLAPPSAFAFAGTVVWAVATDARGRPASFAPALACLGMLVAEPLGHGLVRLARRRPVPIRSWVVAGLAAIAHGVYVVLVARGPGQSSDVRHGVHVSILAMSGLTAFFAALYAVRPKSVQR